MSSSINEDISRAVSIIKPDKVFYLFEDNTDLFCRPLLNLKGGNVIDGILVISPGEENKSLAQVKKVWDFFEETGATRSSLLLTVGGGMLTDLGGFAACTFKRGISFVNVPTTLLSMVDASVGGKTGINYRGLKNEIGVIRQPDEVLIHVPFLRTLDRENFISGFAEMFKAGLIMDSSLWYDLKEYNHDDPDLELLSGLIWRSVRIKNTIVELDPVERNERRSLNLGHTMAHAFESLSLLRGRPIHHGYAVAYGIVVETYLSEQLTGLSKIAADEIRETLLAIYGRPPFSRSDIPDLLGFMMSDKKNDNIYINFTLLSEIGRYSINNYVEREKVEYVLNSVF